MPPINKKAFRAGIPATINHFAAPNENETMATLMMSKKEKKAAKSKKKQIKTKNLFDIISSKKNEATGGGENLAHVGNLGDEKSPIQPKIKFNDVFQLTEKDFEEVDLNQLYKFQMEVRIYI